MIRRLLTAAVVLAAAAAGLVLTGAESSGGEAKTYKIEFDNAFGLTEGGDVKVGGTRVGSTTDFDITEGDAPKAIVEIEITEPGFDSFREDAQCGIEPQSLIGEYFVNCEPGDDRREIPEGETIPVENTSSTIPPDLVNNVMRRPYRERLRLILAELGTGLAGRPEDLNEVLRRAHPGLRETSEVLEILGDQNEVIEDFVVDSDTVLRSLEDRKEEVSRWVREAGRTAEISASRREDLARNFERFPGFLDQLRPALSELSGLTREQTPLLRDLRTAAPDLTEFFSRLGPFSDASRPSLRSLGRASVVGRRALDRSQEEIAALRDLADEAPEFARPLRQFLQSVDTRDRSHEPDPRAANTAPPSPDPTAYREGDGFTGLESVLNYVFWQTLTVNKFDELSHFLSIVGLETECAEYVADVDLDNPREREHAEHCNSWTGPYQPGITAPDPTEDTQVAARERAERANPESAPRGPRGAGDPEAPPRPGQPDLSEPQIVLPPSIQGLLDALPQLGSPGALEQLEGIEGMEALTDVLSALGGGARRGGDPAPTQLLDYLLAP